MSSTRTLLIENQSILTSTGIRRILLTARLGKLVNAVVEKTIELPATGVLAGEAVANVLQVASNNDVQLSITNEGGTTVLTGKYFCLFSPLTTFTITNPSSTDTVKVTAIYG